MVKKGYTNFVQMYITGRGGVGDLIKYMYMYILTQDD